MVDRNNQSIKLDKYIKSYFEVFYYFYGNKWYGFRISSVSTKYYVNIMYHIVLSTKD